MLDGDRPTLAILDLNDVAPSNPELAQFLAACADGERLPILALFSAGSLPAFEQVGPFDDFAVSPFRLPEVAFRIRALLRKHAPEGVGADAVIRVGDLVIDLSRYEVLQGGKRMELTFKEYELLKFFATNPGKVFTRETLLNRVWGYDYYGGTRTVDVHIRRLRSKIEHGPYVFIDTVRNVGYRFNDRPEPGSAPGL
ncbi:MAG: response regulator transcription factor [Chloroflexi bacterium]|nr:response regulator transcription factor [Chloroflexota bacterium]